MTRLYGKLVILGIVVTAVLSLVTGYLDRMATERFRMEKPFWIMNQRNRSCDFAIIGSSRAENCTDVKTIAKLTGRRGVNLGVQGACFADNLIMFRRFVENGNRTKLLLIEVDEYALDSRGSFLDPFKVHFYLPYLDREWVGEVVKDNISRSRYLLWRYLPPTKYLEYNTMYLTYCLQHGLRRSGFDFDATAGTRLEQNEAPFVFDGEKVRKNKKKGKLVDSKDLKYLNDLIAYATGQGIKTALYTVPQYHEQIPYLGNHQQFLSKVGELCDNWQITHGNYETDELSRDRTMFLDASHLNARGAVLFSAKVASMVARLL